jgi:hypothetical protein
MRVTMAEKSANLLRANVDELLEQLRQQLFTL